MKAAILEHYSAPLVVREVEPLALGPHDVLVDVGASGVCHSDLSAQRGQYPFELPIVIGHEGAGTVAEVGDAVTLVRPGDKVIASFIPACGRCWQCLRDRSHLCEAGRALGGVPHVSIDGAPRKSMAGLGTMAQQMTVHESSVVKVETDLPFEQLALIGCGVTTGVGSALWAAGVVPGSTVAVFGCGGVGLSTLQGAVIAGAARVIAVDLAPAKLAMARQLGATDIVDAGAGDPVEQIRALTAGRGVDFTFEVVGRPDTMRQAYDAACRGGTVTFVGAMASDLVLPLPANDLHSSAKRLIGSAYGSAQVRRHMPQLVALAQTGRLDLASMVSATVPLEKVNDAFEAIESGEVVRTVLVP
ncbi:Zn-dependent alcohol dehydrogenase [Pseudofrankia asymbiotica]|uniref:Alcohol dehydrogenase n=1 Tax=Pseudofrankia asymbiotica TaxID=1834516 RepID=A0A1V2I8F7_9ACTN|nr:Zn-dependent alcohol dehydrogenase [Pseudofrankia asymbiotica]ONH27981.1 alcohol dehydrogenase [Pseudofrankia asymbiotica]